MFLSRRRLLRNAGRGLALTGGGTVAAAFLTRRAPDDAAHAQASPAEVGQWQGPFSTPLVGIHAVVLRSGKVLLMHGDHRGRGSLVYLWDPATMAFQQKAAPANVFCSGHCSLPDGRSFFAGGHIDVDKGIRDAYIFDPMSETWTGRNQVAPMAEGRWYPTCTALPDGRVLAVAGGTETGAANRAPEV